MRTVRFAWCVVLAALVYPLYGAECFDDLGIWKMEKVAILAKYGTTLHQYNDVSNICVNFFVKSNGRNGIKTNEITKVLNKKYVRGSKRENKWENFYDSKYAHGYWAFFDKKGDPVFMLCFFDKEQSGYNRTNSFWGITGLSDMRFPSDKDGRGPGKEMYEIIESGIWNGTFESMELEKLLFNDGH